MVCKAEKNGVIIPQWPLIEKAQRKFLAHLGVKSRSVSLKGLEILLLIVFPT